MLPSVPFRIAFSAVCTGLSLAAASAAALAEDAPSAPIVQEDWQILIRPANGYRSGERATIRLQRELSGNPIHAAYRPDATGPELTAAAQTDLEPRPEGAAAPAVGVEVKSPQPPAGMPMLAGPPLISYAEAYAAVPFHRAEYEANPGYRHDAAIELMFGQLRPTTIMRQNTPYYSRYPDFYRFPFPNYPGYQRVDLFQYGTYASPFAYPYGLRSPP